MVEPYISGVVFAWLMLWPVAFILIGVIGLSKYIYNKGKKK